MTRLQAVAFDLMDTVLHDPYREALEAGTGLSLEVLRERRGAHWAAWPAFERGELDEEEYWRLHEEHGIAIDRAAFHRARRAGYHFLPGMAELVEQLRGQVRCVVASNYPVWITELEAGLLAGRFDAVYASHHLGVRKPEAGFFRQLLRRTGTAPHELLFVDDRPGNVDAARRLGIEAHRFDGVCSLAGRLREEGLEVSLG